MPGYIYIRNHPSYDIENCCKMGKTNNIPERDTQYATGEIKRGYFETVYEVPIEKTGFIEKLLQLFIAIVDAKLLKAVYRKVF
jgi:hypothetical protein